VGEFDKVLVFGAQSCAGYAMTFHVMTDYGIVRSRVPVHMLCWKPDAPLMPLDHLQLWDCFHENVSVITYDYLYEKRCQVVLRDKSRVWASYLFTVDWYRNGYSDEPTDYKCGHVLVADDGYLLCQPNNRIYWKDSNWITKDFPIDQKLIRVDDDLPSVEAVSDRWVTEDSGSFYYDLNPVLYGAV